jgi:hypothetical protein
MMLRKSDGVERIEIEDGIVLKHGGNIHILNATAMRIFDLADGSRSHDEIVAMMRDEYDGEDVHAAVSDFIRNLLDAGLIHG